MFLHVLLLFAMFCYVFVMFCNVLVYCYVLLCFCYVLLCFCCVFVVFLLCFGYVLLCFTICCYVLLCFAVGSLGSRQGPFLSALRPLFKPLLRALFGVGVPGVGIAWTRRMSLYDNAEGGGDSGGMAAAVAPVSGGMWGFEDQLCPAGKRDPL